MLNIYVATYFTNIQANITDSDYTKDEILMINDHNNYNCYSWAGWFSVLILFMKTQNKYWFNSIMTKINIKSKIIKWPAQEHQLPSQRQS
jgi:hypothetical protein